MATGGYEELAEELQCPVCYEEMDKPKVLNCRHVFCHNCLKKLLYDDMIPCPLCKQVQKIERTSGVEGLPEPLILNNLQEKITRFLTISKDTGKITKTCLHCSKSAAYFCRDCGEYMCSSCQTEHAQDLITKEHSITLMSKWTICMEHEEKLIIGYCKDCKTGLCSRCTKSEHSKHHIVNINDRLFLDGRRATLQNRREVFLREETYFDVTKLKSDLKTHMQNIDVNIRDSVNKLDNLITVIKELKQKTQQEAAAEKKKLELFVSDMNDLVATKNSVCTFINEILKRDSAPEIVMAVDELPDITTNMAPISPLRVIQKFGDTSAIQEKILDLNKHSTTPSDIKSLQTEDLIDLDSKVAHKDGVSLSVTHPLVLPYTKYWEVTMGVHTSDIVWAEEESVLWLRTIDNLYKCKDNGTKILEIGRGLIGGHGRLCSKLGHGLIAGCSEQQVLCFDKSGAHTKTFTVPESGCLRGITHCSHKDVYVLSDVDKHCLWFINSNNGKVRKQVGSHGSTDTQFNGPFYICNKTISDEMCHIIVSDQSNHCIKIFTHDGDFIKKLGSHGPCYFQLNRPSGVCVDRWGRIIVCDQLNKRVVCFTAEGRDERISVLISSAELRNEYPFRLGISKDTHTLVVGFLNSFRAYVQKQKV